MAELIYNIGKEEQKMSIEFKTDKESGNMKGSWKQEGNRITNMIEIKVSNIPGTQYILYPISFLEKTVFITTKCENSDFDKYINAFFLGNPEGFYLRIMDNPYVNDIPELVVHITATGF